MQVWRPGEAGVPNLGLSVLTALRVAFPQLLRQKKYESESNSAAEKASRCELKGTESDIVGVKLKLFVNK